jgi:hypothetical protein
MPRISVSSAFSGARSAVVDASPRPAVPTPAPSSAALNPEERDAAARRELQELTADLGVLALAFRAVADRVTALERLLGR